MLSVGVGSQKSVESVVSCNKTSSEASSEAPSDMSNEASSDMSTMAPSDASNVTPSDASNVTPSDASNVAPSDTSNASSSGTSSEPSNANIPAPHFFNFNSSQSLSTVPEEQPSREDLDDSPKPLDNFQAVTISPNLLARILRCKFLTDL